MILTPNIGFKSVRGKTKQEPAPSYEPETTSYLNEVDIPDDDSTSIYGITNNAVWVAVNNFVLELKTIGIFKFKAVYPLLTNTATGQAVNLKDPNSFRVVWSGTATHNASGYTGNGSDAYGNSNLNQLNDSELGNESFGFYCFNNIQNTSVDMGLADFSVSNRGTHIFSNFGSSREIVFRSQSESTAGHQETTFPETSIGFTALSRTDTSEVRIQRDSGIATQQITAEYVYNLNFFLGARNTGGTATSFSSRNYGYFYISEGLTQQEMLNHYNAVQQLQITLNRI